VSTVTVTPVHGPAGAVEPVELGEDEAAGEEQAVRARARARAPGAARARVRVVRVTDPQYGIRMPDARS